MNNFKRLLENDLNEEGLKEIFKTKSPFEIAQKRMIELKKEKKKRSTAHLNKRKQNLNKAIAAHTKRQGDRPLSNAVAAFT